MGTARALVEVVFRGTFMVSRSLVVTAAHRCGRPSSECAPWSMARSRSTGCRESARKQPAVNDSRWPGPTVPQARRQLPLVNPCDHSEGLLSGSTANSQSRPLPVIRSAEKSLRRRPVSKHSSHRPTAPRREPLSKPVVRGFAVLVDLRCKPCVRSSISRTGTADPKRLLENSKGRRWRGSAGSRPDCKGEESRGSRGRHR